MNVNYNYLLSFLLVFLIDKLLVAVEAADETTFNVNSNNPKILTRNPKSIVVGTNGGSTFSQEKAINSNNIVKNFQINKNSIIKTHDSQALGAKYINETELSSNEECLFWCWNTSNCNLAVFEEKTRGSCYLFDCGTVQNFKCRFASHTFYTSSILQINRNSYLLNEWKSQANSENELQGLKEKQSLATSNSNSDQQQRQTDVQQQQSTLKLETTTVSLVKVSKCRHYQFECRNNSECIAIYNVCDGIAQCPDGSDEAIELECHKSRLNVNTLNDNNRLSSDSIIPDNNKNSKTQQQSVVDNRLISSAAMNNYANYPSYSSYKDIGNGQQQSSPSTVKLNTNLNYNYPKSPNEKIMLDENSFTNRNNHIQMNVGNTGGGAGDYNGYYTNWNQYSLPNDKLSIALQASNDQNTVEQQQTNNNNNVLKDSTLYWPSFKYPVSSSNMENFMHQQQQQQASDVYNVPGSSSSSSSSMLKSDIRSKVMDGYPSQQQFNPSSFRMQAAAVAQQQPSSSPPLFVSSLINELKSNAVDGQRMRIDDQNRKNDTSSKNKLNYVHMISSNDKMSVRTPNLVAISYMHDTMAQNGRETNSAVIALTLGLFITCILIVIVGCRMKSFKKRLARRGRSLAHDADYLINGMYL